MDHFESALLDNAGSSASTARAAKPVSFRNCSTALSFKLTLVRITTCVSAAAAYGGTGRRRLQTPDSYSALPLQALLTTSRLDARITAHLRRRRADEILQPSASSLLRNRSPRKDHVPVPARRRGPGARAPERESDAGSLSRDDRPVPGRSRPNVSWPASNARCRPARYFARKTVDSARTGNKNEERPPIHREPSATNAPPVTRQCRWRC